MEIRMFEPNFVITPTITKALMEIEACRQAVSDAPVTLAVLTSLRESARLTSTHYSTQIEGNKLTQKQVERVLKGEVFPNRERDEQEVKNYYLALDYLDTLAASQRATISENQLKMLHGLVMEGKKKPTPYRDGQNVIRDSRSGGIVYMPPEAKDVSSLMDELLNWVASERKSKNLPIPIVAALAHYQYATIHPYYDGNGRTARLLTNLVLHQSGYGLKGIYSLEEYYAQNLSGYYRALDTGDSHNYYMGRSQADLTAWVDYFCGGMAQAFINVKRKVEEVADEKPDQHHFLRDLDQRQKKVLELFRNSRFITTKEIADHLGIHRRTALNLCHDWIENEFLLKHGQANKSRKYELSTKWMHLIE